MKSDVGQRLKVDFNVLKLWTVLSDDRGDPWIWILCLESHIDLEFFSEALIQHSIQEAPDLGKMVSGSCGKTKYSWVFDT